MYTFGQGFEIQKSQNFGNLKLAGKKSDSFRVQFAVDQHFSGSTDSTILVVPGVHCRLEDISQGEDGKPDCWVRDVTFEIGSVVTVRKQGEPVGNIMTSWRKLRREEPEKLRGKRIWQSTTAFVDSVIYSWQQEEESARFPNLLRLVDSLSTHWTEQAAERNWLCNALQADVPASCTPLGQITDTGLAQPGKAACRQTHEHQRYLFKLKARQQKTKPVLKVGAREVCEAVDAMDSCWHRLNQESEVVLAEGRACGWLHFRPDREGLLVKAGTQQWAKRFTEGSSRMGPEFRKNRDSWVQEGKVQPLKPEELEKAQDGPDAADQQGDYFKPVHAAGPVLEIETAQPAEDFLTPHQLFGLNCALLHPSARTRQEEVEAQLVLVTSQKPRSSKAVPQPKETREQKVARWQEALGSKSIAARLAALVPVKGKRKKDQKKQLLKSVKKGIFKSVSDKLKAAKNAKKSAQKQEKHKAEQEKKKAEESASHAHELIGQRVRCIAPDATRFWKNQAVVVKSFNSKSQMLTVTHADTGTARQLSPDHVAEIPAVQKAAMADKLNLARLTNLQRQRVWLETGNLNQMADEQLVEGPELTASWYEVFFRGLQAGDQWAPGQVVYMEPHSFQASVYAWQTEDQGAVHQVESVRAQMETARSDAKCLILAPIQAGQPDHWTLLSFIRLQGESQFTVRHEDSLSAVHANCRLQAEASFRFLVAMGVQCTQPALPATELPVNQGDHWSCGWQTVNRMEEAYRAFRGEGRKRVYVDKQARRQLTNWFSDHLVSKCSKADEAKAAPPLPPPSAPPAAAQPAELLGPSGLPQAACKETGFGCSKCRHSEAGCLQCNPAKALKFAEAASKK